MKLLFLDSVDRRTYGGYENWIVLVAQHFVGRGHQVTVAGRPGSEYLRRAAAASDQIEILELPISGDFNPVTICKLKRALAARQIDLMTVNFNKDVRIGGLAARWYGATKVCWRLGLDMTSSGWVHKFLSPRLIDGVIVPSHALKKQVIRHGYLTDDMVQVIHNGTADKTFDKPDDKARRALREKYKLEPERLVAVTVGRFVDQKGHVYLVDAAREIVRQVPEIAFLFLGDGEHEAMLRDRIAQYQLERHFIFAGMLDNLDLEYGGADMMIHPAIEEPFSHSILEGMRAGLPIVASEVGGIPEALAESAATVMVPSRDPDALAAAVVDMLASSRLREQTGLANQDRWRENFRLKTMMQKVEAYFASILGRSKLT
jgi:glycosyltransferase involved in cell wall biosynthesis